MKILSIAFLCLFFVFFSHLPSYAVENPLEKPNNSMGIHILFPQELEQAAKLVNSSGGEWGYVTIPIQAGERDLEKWQKFMDDCSRLKLIPLVRLATEPDAQNDATWRVPNDYDVIDFANFLNSLSWPTKNRYVILFNEVNHAAEWGGNPPDPKLYGEIVKYAGEVFKSRNSNFYLILGGMDVAAPDDYIKHMNGYTYLERLRNDPEVLNSVDAFSSHAYPNPDFSAPPLENRKNNIASYRFEYELINEGREKKLPVFITETGWSDKKLPASTISRYYETAVQNIWSKDNDKIVAITPFLLNSSGGPFDNFSFLKNGEEKSYFKVLAALPKLKGEPGIEPFIGGIAGLESTSLLASVTFRNLTEKDELEQSPFVKLYFKTILGLN